MNKWCLWRAAQFRADGLNDLATEWERRADTEPQPSLSFRWPHGWDRDMAVRHVQARHPTMPGDASNLFVLGELTAILDAQSREDAIGGGGQKLGGGKYKENLHPRGSHGMFRDNGGPHKEHGGSGGSEHPASTKANAATNHALQARTSKAHSDAHAAHSAAAKAHLSAGNQSAHDYHKSLMVHHSMMHASATADELGDRAHASGKPSDHKRAADAYRTAAYEHKTRGEHTSAGTLTALSEKHASAAGQKAPASHGVDSIQPKKFSGATHAANASHGVDSIRPKGHAGTSAPPHSTAPVQGVDSIRPKSAGGGSADNMSRHAHGLSAQANNASGHEAARSAHGEAAFAQLHAGNRAGYETHMAQSRAHGIEKASHAAHEASSRAAFTGTSSDHILAAAAHGDAGHAFKGKDDAKSAWHFAEADKHDSHALSAANAETKRTGGKTFHDEARRSAFNASSDAAANPTKASHLAAHDSHMSAAAAMRGIGDHDRAQEHYSEADRHKSLSRIYG